MRKAVLTYHPTLKKDKFLRFRVKQLGVGLLWQLLNEQNNVLAKMDN